SAATTMSGPRSTCPALAATYSVTIRSNSPLTRLPSSLLGEPAPTVPSSSSLSLCTASSAAASAAPASSRSISAPSVGSARPGSPSRDTRRPWPCRGRVPKYQIAASRISPATRMPMRNSAMPLLRRSCRGSRGAGQARGLGQVHGYQAAHARLAHGNPAQLLRRFHRRLVVGDEQELHLLAHLRDHRGEAADVGLVERRIHLVKQAERRRVEPENREHQRHRRHRLLAARQ